MSMTLDVGDDSDELDDRDDIDRDDDDDDDGDDRSTRGSGRRRPKGKADDDDEPDDEDDADDLSPEELRAELKKVRGLLARTGKQTARQRTARRAAEKRLRELEGASDDDGDEEDDDEKTAPTARSIQKTVSRAVRERERVLQEEHRRDLINTRAETALARAGVSDRNVRLLLKELDVEEIDFDAKTRSIDGLDEEIDRLKDEFPDLFRRPRGERRRINGGDSRDDGPKRKRPMTATEIQVAQLKGR